MAPWGLARNPVNGELVVGDYLANRLRRYAVDGTFLGDFVDPTGTAGGVALGRGRRSPGRLGVRGHDVSEGHRQLYRACRRQGETVRKLADCLIAAHAIRTGSPVLHADASFDVLAKHTALRTG